jgi:hypothetical protein
VTADEGDTANRIDEGHVELGVVEVGKHVGQVREDAMCREGRGQSEARGTVGGAELEEMERVTRRRVGVGM